MTAVRQFLEYFALSGLGVCALVLLGVWCDRHQVFPGRRLLGAFRRLPRPVQFFLLAFSLHLIVHGSIKTNAVGSVEGAAQQRGRDILVACNEAVATLFSRDRNVASPLGGKGRGAGRAPYGLGRSVAPEAIARGWRLVEVNTNATFDYSMPSNAVCHAPWTLRGAAEDWTRIELGSENEELGMADWRFPFGTNDLSAVQVFTDGTIRPKLHSLSNQLVAVGSPMSAIPGVSRFWYAVGTNDSRILTWENFALGRMPVGGGGDSTNGCMYCRGLRDSIFAQIELFRSGDYIVRSNGVEWVFRFVDPFEWPDGEWDQSDADRASIDAVVGTGLENGYYKLTVTVPPSVGRRTLITVGDQRLAVDRPGEYAFLLAKGEEYALSLEPFSPDIAFTAVDDITPPMMLMGFAGESNDHLGRWTVDGGELQLVYPTFASAGRIWWMPTFCGSPEVAHLGPDSGAMTFTALLSDYRYAEAVAYHWSCEDRDVVIASPNSRETTITFATMPSWRASTLTVTATVGTNELRSVLAGFTYGTNDTPQVHFSFSVPDAVLLNSNRTDNAKLRKMSLSFSSDVETNGSIRLSCASGADRIAVWESSNRTSRVSLPQVWEAADFAGFEAFVEGAATSESVDDVRLKAEFISGPDEPLEQGKDLTVVEVGEVSLPGAPDDGLVVLSGTSVLFEVDCIPADAASLISTLWETRQMRSGGVYGDWAFAGRREGCAMVFNTSTGGIYQVRTAAGFSGGAFDIREYHWNMTEPRDFGCRRRNECKAFGVCDELWQLQLRNRAHQELGSEEYVPDVELAPRYGFSSYPEEHPKCNIFVAHMIVASGLSCPVQHRGTWHDTRYPPTANEWCTPTTTIDGWSPCNVDAFPQPGLVVALSGNPMGHCGILDFDGAGISAQGNAVTRRSVALIRGRYRVYERRQDETER